MQIIGLLMLAFIVWYGFADRHGAVISAFDFHAFVMVVGGSTGAILVSSSFTTALRTFTALREILPGLGTLQSKTDALEAERVQLAELWRDGRRAAAVDLASNSKFPAISKMLELIMNRAPAEATHSAFVERQHEALQRWQPAISNWEMLSKLSPSFGMVGTITGMVQLFKNMGEDNMNIGAAMSLALLATLYGVAFGAGVAGPIGHYLRNLLDQYLGALERCEESVKELIAVSRVI